MDSNAGAAASEGGTGPGTREGMGAGNVEAREGLEGPGLGSGMPASASRGSQREQEGSASGSGAPGRLRCCRVRGQEGSTGDQGGQEGRGCRGRLQLRECLNSSRQSLISGSRTSCRLRSWPLY